MTTSSRKLLNIILALLVSLGAWMFVVYNYYPMTVVSYTDVPLTYEGQRGLAERGLAVSEASTEGIGVKLNQRRVNFNKYSAKDITVVANVSECVAGDNDVSLNVSSPRDTSVVSHDTDTIRVTVERSESEYMDIDVIYSDTGDENEEPLVSYMGNESAEVVCAVSKLSKIKRVAAVLDRSEVGDSIKSYTANLVALDENGHAVPYAVIYPDEISLDASAGAVKKVALEVPVKGGSDEDYERKHTEPKEITIKGPLAEMSKIESIKAEEIDISQYYIDSEIDIELDLPEGVVLKDPDDAPVMKLTVSKIEKPEVTEENSENKEDGDGDAGN